MSQDTPKSSQDGLQGQPFSSKPIPLLRQRSNAAGMERRSLDLPMLGLDPKKSGSSLSDGGSVIVNETGKSGASSTKPAQSLDEQWVEMQNTLGEVEASAAAGSVSLFSASHASALQDLRKAQIALAQAWARSETDDVDADGDITDTGHTSEAAHGTANMLARDRADRLKQGSKSAAGGTGSGSGKTKLEEETENDIALARKRRAANDRYFERVNKGVVDVVDKLEAVARKMKNVEMEDVWGSEDTFESESIGG